jgi:hypothetical protein
MDKPRKAPFYTYVAVLAALIAASFALSAAQQPTGLASSPGFFEFLSSLFSSSQQFQPQQTPISSCTSISSSGSYELTQNVLAGGSCINITASNVDFNCQGFTINYSGSVVGAGINVTDSRNVTVQNCRVLQTSASQAFSPAIVFVRVNDSAIAAAFVNATGSSSIGISLSNSSRNVLTHILAEGPGGGIHLTLGSSSNNITNATGLSNGGSGISILANSNRNIVINSTGFSTGGGNQPGISFINAANNTLINVVGRTITHIGLFIQFSGDNIFNNVTASSNLTALQITDSDNNVFFNTTLVSNNQWIFETGVNNFTNTLFDNLTYGSIRIPQNFTLNFPDPSSIIIDLQKLNIAFNRAFLNSTNLTFMNQSAQITLRGINVDVPGMQVDFNDDGAFEDCSAPQCQNVSYSASTFIFNVTSFTTYRIADGSFPTCPDILGDLDVTGTINVTSNITCRRITVHSGGIIVVNNSAPAAGNQSISIAATENFTLLSGGYINATGRGFGGGNHGGQNGFGPGGGNGSTFMGSGAGHGGKGGNSRRPSTGAKIDGGLAYGSSLSPVTLGSGGGGSGDAGSGAQGGAGGGAIIISAQRVTINGTMNASGVAGGVAGSGNCGVVSCGAGGGSGGTISIITNVFEGSGTMSANGGDGVFASNIGGAGGGGRIIVRFNSSTYAIAGASVRGGINASKETIPGSPGTLGFLDMDDDVLTIYQSWRWQGNDRSVWNFTVINVTNALARTNDSSLNFSTPLLLLTGSVITGESSLYNLTINATVFVMNPSNITNATFINITAVNFTMLAGSDINSSGTGFAGGTISQGGTGPGNGSADSNLAGGGGHCGGGGESQTARGGTSYDSPLNPSEPGSGGAGGNGAVGGAGGGVIRLTAARATINGTVNAGGVNVGGGLGALGGGGGGAGGTIRINATTLEGQGIITAKGGDVGDLLGNGGGGGGGGCIVIHYSNITFPLGNISVAGGAKFTASDNTMKAGEAGSLALIDVDDNSITVKDGFYFTVRDSPFFFRNFTSPGFAFIRSNGTLVVNISGTLDVNNSNITVYGNRTSYNVTRLLVRNSTLDSASGRLELGFGSAFDDTGSRYASGSLLTLRNTSTAEIFFGDATTAQATNLSRNTRLTPNRVFVNSTANTGLNVSANVTLFGLAINQPKIVVDLEDDGTFADCPASRCTILSYAGGRLIFNATSFTTYQANETGVSITLTKTDSPDPVNESSQLNYTIVINVTNGNATNITLIDTYPPQVSFVSASPSPTSGNNTFFIGNLSEGQYIQVNITVLVPGGLSNGTVINNTANITFFNLTGGFFSAQVVESTTVVVPAQQVQQENEGQIVVTLQQVASLSFAISSVNWGSGYINTSAGNSVCVLDTEGSNSNSQCRNFSTVTQGLVLENDGSINLTVDLRSNATADQFIGGASPVFRWKVSQNESSSCGNLTGPASYVDVNTTAPGTRICSTFFATGLGGLNFLNDRDTIEIDLNVTVPYDSLQGTKRALIIATGTAV